jgi:hypothetical protein
MPGVVGATFKNSNLHVFTWEILTNMTQMSDVAPGPLVIVVVIQRFMILFDEGLMQFVTS